MIQIVEIGKKCFLSWNMRTGVPAANEQQARGLFLTREHGSGSTGLKHYHQGTSLSRDRPCEGVRESQSTRELIPDNTRWSPKKYLKFLIYCITLERKMVSMKKKKKKLSAWNFLPTLARGISEQSLILCRYMLMFDICRT